MIVTEETSNLFTRDVRQVLRADEVGLRWGDNVGPVLEFDYQSTGAAAVAASVGFSVVGGIYIVEAAATGTSGTEKKAAGTTQSEPGSAAVNTDMAASNRLRFTGTTSTTVRVAANFSSLAADDLSLMTYSLALNGSVLTHTRISNFQTWKLAGSGESSATEYDCSVSCTQDVDEDDYFELWLHNETNNGDTTITLMVMTMVGALQNAGASVATAATNTTPVRSVAVPGVTEPIETIAWCTARDLTTPINGTRNVNPLWTWEGGLERPLKIHAINVDNPGNQYRIRMGILKG